MFSLYVTSYFIYYSYTWVLYICALHEFTSDHMQNSYNILENGTHKEKNLIKLSISKIYEVYNYDLIMKYICLCKMIVHR